MIEYIVMIITVLSTILALIQRDLLKTAVLIGIAGAGIAYIYQVLLAPDVALTQVVVGAAIVPVFFALAIQKTKRDDS